MNHEIFVSPLGCDEGKGTIEEPFRTLACAVHIATSGSHILLRGGIYPIKETVTLSNISNVTIEAYPGEKVTIIGGRCIRFEDFTPVQDEKIRKFLPQNAVEADLTKLENLAYGTIRARGFRRPYIPAPIELIVDGKVMQLSRYPKQSDFPIKEVLDAGSISMDVDDPDYSNRGGTFRYEDDRISDWKHLDGIEATGFFSVGYADDTIPVAGVNTVERTVTLRDAVMFGIRAAERTHYHFLNVLEELCLPGEYYVDQIAEKLYFIPPANFTKESIIYLTETEQPLLCLINTKRVSLKNMTIAASRGIGIYMDQGEGNVLENLNIQYMGIVGVVIGKGITPDENYRHHFYRGEPITGALGSLNEHLYNDIMYNRDAGTGHIIRNCEIAHCGAGGVSIGGGDRKTLTPAGNCVEKCTIYDCNRLDKSLKALINIDGVGNIIRSCHLYQATNMAIMIHGNEHIIEYNNIHHACTDTEDAGAIYLGRDPSEQGNVIRFNYIHDIMAAHRPNVPLRDGLGSFAIYNDDNACGTIIYGNIFFRAGNWAIHNNCCSDIKIENNIFIECQTAVVHGDRFWGVLNTDSITRPGGLFHDRLINQAKIFEPPYCERYPNLTKFFDNNGKPCRNIFSNNIMYRCLNTLATRHKDEWYINDYYLTNPRKSWQDVIAEYKGWYQQVGNYVIGEDPSMDGKPIDLHEFQREDILGCVMDFHRIPIEKIAGIQ